MLALKYVKENKISFTNLKDIFIKIQNIAEIILVSHRVTIYSSSNPRLFTF